MEPRVRRTLLLHTVSWFLFGAYQGGATQQLGFIIGKLGGSGSLVALATTGPAVLPILSFLIIPWGERHSSRALVSWSRFSGAAILILAAFRVTPAALAVVAFAAMAIYTTGNTFYGRFVGRIYPDASRGRMLSFPMFASSAAAFGASLLAGWALSSGPEAHRWVLPAAAVLGAGSSLLLLQLPADRGTEPIDRVSIREALRHAVADRPFFIWTIFYSYISMGFWLASSTQPVYESQMLRLDYWQFGVSLASYNVFFCGGLLVWGRIRDRIGSRPVVALGFLMSGVGYAVMVSIPRFEAVVLGKILIGAGMSGNNLSRLLAVLEYAPGKRIDRYMGLFMTFYGVRALLGGLIGATFMEVSSTGSRLGLAVAAGIVITGAVAIIWSPPPTRDRSPS